jgi:predicted methyltransferase
MTAEADHTPPGVAVLACAASSGGAQRLAAMPGGRLRPAKIATDVIHLGEYSMLRNSIAAAGSLLAALALMITATPGSAAAKAPDAIAVAVADASRPDADKQRDANRRPVETLEFTGVKPGDQVAELLPGSGYFTRIFSKVVGPSGHVYALVPAPAPDAPPDTPDFAARVKALAAEPAYSNVSVVVEPFSQLKAPVPVDLVWTSQNYHDLHNFPGLDVGVFNQMVFDTLKPGGIYLIVDHEAEAGSGVRDTATLHRIDVETVKKEVLAAGFVLVGSSELLRRPADTHTVKVFDPSVRGKTDQFILKFRKPKK